MPAGNCDRAASGGIPLAGAQELRDHLKKRLCSLQGVGGSFICWRMEQIREPEHSCEGFFPYVFPKEELQNSST